MEESLSCNGETADGGGRDMEAEEKSGGASVHEDKVGESKGEGEEA